MMTTLTVPDIAVQPAVVGSRGARALQRLELDNQRRARMLSTLKKMGLDAPPTSATRRSSIAVDTSRNNSAESVRRSSEPLSNDGDKSLHKTKNGRRRSLMIESLGPMHDLRQGIGGTAARSAKRTSLGAVQDLSEDGNGEEEHSSNTLSLFETPFRNLRSGRRKSLLVTPKAELRQRTPRTSIEGNLLNAEEETLQLPLSRRRSRRGARTPKPRGGYLSTGQGEKMVQVVDTEVSEKKKQEQTVCRFRSCVRLLICFMRLCESYFLSAADDSSRDFYDDAVQLMFDVRFFKAIKQSDISQDCRSILATPPHQRTEKEKYHALISMRNFATFAEYPLTMQQEIVSCGWYARYEAKRVILRQGHWPLNFYFILSGSAVVRVVQDGIAKTVVYLNRGETFGELGIVNRAVRQSTVIAREYIELLCISDEDYTRIFMAGGLTKLLDPDQDDFVKNLRFLDGWPLPLLAQSPKKCIFSYFKRKDVLVKDSKQSDWIVIVKSGSCSVMKLLYKDVLHGDPLASSDKALPKGRNVSKKSSAFAKPRMSEGNLENFEQRQKREDFEDFMKDLNIQDHRDSIEYSLRENTLDKYRDNPLASIVEQAEGNKRVGGGKASRSQRGKKNNVPQMSRTAFLARKKAHERVFQEVAIISDVKPSEEKEPEEPSVSRQVTDVTMEAPVGKRKTLVDEIMDTDLAAEETAGLEPVWVTVQTLTKGSVFGLAEMMFDDQPSFVVVSNGAECILLSKKFYMEHATLALLSRLRKEEHRFPTEDELKAGLEIKLQWNTYKEAHMNQTLEHKRRTKAPKS